MNEIEQLKREIAELKAWKKNMEASFSIPLNVDQAFRDRFLKDVTSLIGILGVANGGTGATTLTGILKGNGTGAFTAISPLSGANTYYAAPSSGASPTVGLNFSNGILVSVS